MSAPVTGTYRDSSRGAIGLVLLIAVACLGAAVVVTVLFCAPRVL